MSISIEKEKTEQQEVIVEEVEKYDIVADRSSMNALVGSQEVDALTTEIAIDDENSIVMFGSEVANEIGKASDVILNSMSLTALDKTSDMMKSLTKIMGNFDIDEIQNEPKGIQKLFTNAKKQLDKVVGKYNTMGKEVDKIYIELKKYEDEIKKSNQTLSDMFETNVNTYHELVKYILAGEQAQEEIKNYIADRESEYAKTNDGEIQFQITTANQALMLMEQRTQDLRTAESVAMQAIPMIKTMQFANLNLVRKIESSFMITLPVFKQSLAQAMLLKRQAIQSESLSKLDEATNEMLLKNAKNVTENSKKIMQQASQSSIKTETLEKTWQTIMQGIDDTKRIQEETRKQRIEDQKKLESIKSEFQAKYGTGSKA